MTKIPYEARRLAATATATAAALLEYIEQLDELPFDRSMDPSVGQ